MSVYRSLCARLGSPFGRSAAGYRWNRASAEARDNGLTEQKLEQLLQDA